MKPSASTKRIAPNGHPERNEVAAERQLEDFVEFRRAGEPAQGWFRCVDCGFGAAAFDRLPLCARCHGRLWEREETSPFETAPPPRPLDADLVTSLRAMVLAVVFSALLWAGLVALAFELFK